MSEYTKNKTTKSGIKPWMPFSKISYKDYWENIKKEYLKEINKN